MNKKTPLNTDKELLRLWYEFYRLALQSTDKDVIRAVKKSRDFYKDWQVDVTEKFDSWWAKHRLGRSAEHTGRPDCARKTDVRAMQNGM